MSARDSATTNHYWGKADPGYPGEPKWHPLACQRLEPRLVGDEYPRYASLPRRLFTASAESCGTVADVS